MSILFFLAPMCRGVNPFCTTVKITVSLSTVSVHRLDNKTVLQRTAEVEPSLSTVYFTMVQVTTNSFKESNDERFTFAIALGLALFSNRNVATLSLL